MKGIGADPVAHPSDTGEQNILALVQNGLEGLEVYTSYHSPRNRKDLAISPRPMSSC